MTFLKKTLAFTLIASTLSILPAFAKTPSDASLNRLATVSKVDDSFKDGVKIGFIAMFGGHVQKNLADAGIELNKQQQAELTKALDNYGDKMTKDIVSPALLKTVRQEFKTIAKKHYSQDEVDAMIEFYSTPVGRSVMNKQGAMTAEFSQSVLTIIGNDETYNTNLNKASLTHTPDFDKELEAIIK